MDTSKELKALLKKVKQHEGTYRDFDTRLFEAADKALSMGNEGRVLFAEHAFSYILDERNLYLAMQHLRIKGGHSPGPDGHTYEDFPTESVRWALCRNFRDTLKSQEYQPSEYETIQIPKSSGGFRTIVLMNLSDRIILRGITQVLQPIIDPEFFESSYGYRPRRNRAQMISAACKIAEEQNRYYWIKADIKDAFPSIPPNAVIKLIRSRLDSQPLNELISKCLKQNGRVRGVLQGSPLSPLCVNLYLHDRIDRLWQKRCPKIPMLRYADDFLILARSESEAKKALGNLKFLVSKACLELKQSDRSPIYNLASGEHIKALGMDCSINRKKIFEIRPAEDSISDIIAELKDLDDGKNTVNRIFMKLAGWVSQQAFAYHKSTALKVMSEIIANFKVRKIQNKVPTFLGKDDGNEEIDQSKVWKLGVRKRWIEYWEDCNSRIKSQLDSKL